MNFANINLTDIILGVLSLLFFISGYSKGLLKTLLGPICLIIAGIASYAYFTYIKPDILIALAISILGPIPLWIIGGLILNLIHTVNQDKKSFSVTRILGGLIHSAWCLSMILLVLFTIVLIPNKFETLAKVQNSIRQSASFKITNKLLGNHFDQGTKHIQGTTNFFKSKENLAALESTKEYKALINHPKMKALLNDPKLVDAIENKNYMALMSNPKMQELLRDPEIMKLMLKMNEKFLKTNPTE